MAIIDEMTLIQETKMKWKKVKILFCLTSEIINKHMEGRTREAGAKRTNIFRHNALGKCILVELSCTADFMHKCSSHIFSMTSTQVGNDKFSTVFRLYLGPMFRNATSIDMFCRIATTVFRNRLRLVIIKDYIWKRAFVGIRIKAKDR